MILNQEMRDQRDWDWWRRWISGESQASIARSEGVDQSTVSDGCARVRAQIPPANREDELERSLAMLHELRAGALEVYRSAPAPVFVGKDGIAAQDPVSGEWVRDHSGRMQALGYALKVDDTIARRLGLDAASKIDLGVGQLELDTARRLAEDARARLNEGADDAG